MNSFNYYGFDKETYETCLDMVKDLDLRHMKIILTWFLMDGLFNLLFSCLGLFGVSRERVSFYLVYSVLAALFLSAIVFLKFTQNFVIPLIYLSMALLISYSILLSINQPYMVAAMYMVSMVVLALSYVDTMGRMALALLICCAAFIISSILEKPVMIAYQDIYNAAVFLSLSLPFHYLFQRARLQRFVTHQRNIQIQRDLVVKSSFDALTQLLNRGRFFSLAADVVKNHKNEYVALCMLDLDGFKKINDELGHQMGDKAIQLAGNALIDSLGIDLSEKWSFPERALEEKMSFAGRLGGDEFIVIVRGKKNRS
ncbi:MAG: GGDEF domain-containing protein [Lachnospiraceae bacterium]|nr:GGDEF domain-containing protein [Lachnospiraceae bacterium]